MKLNQELIKRLAAGEIAYKPNSVDDEHFYTITDACGCPRKTYNSPRIIPIFFISGFTRIWLYYNDFEIENRNLNLPIYTTEQFFEVEIPKQDFTIQCDPNENPYGENKNKMDKETRELAKQLFVKYSGVVDGAMEIAIKDAKHFIQLLNNE